MEPRPVSLLLGLAAILLVSPAVAHGIPDQVHDPNPDGSGAILCNGSQFQSFTPGGPSDLLIAVDLRLQYTAGFPAAGVNTQVRIRQGSPSGPVLGTASTFVPANLPDSQPLIHYDFATPILATPGNTYVIEKIAPQLGWQVLLFDSYPGGNAYQCTTAAPVADRDFGFVTYKLGQGACCFGFDGTCQDSDSESCVAQGGFFRGDGTECSEVDCEAVPTVTEWGLIVMTGLLLLVGAGLFGRRQA